MDTTLYEEWLLAKGLDPSTVNIYRGKLVAASRIAGEQGWDLGRMTASELGSLASYFPDSHASLSLLRATLIHYWTMLGVANPVGAIVLPGKPPARYKGLADTDADRLEACAVGVWPSGIVVMLGLYLALRRAEMASLRWDSFTPDLSEARIVGKGRRTRFLPVHEALQVELASHICYGYLFPGRHRDYVHTATIRRWVGDMAAHADLTITNPHALRYTCATRLYEQTGDIHLVQEFLGHSDPSTTSRYLTRVREERMRAAVQTLNYRMAA